jgi:hypothetical protein
MTRKREAREGPAIAHNQARLTIYCGDNEPHRAAYAGAEQRDSRCDGAGEDSPRGRAGRCDGLCGGHGEKIGAYRLANACLWAHRQRTGLARPLKDVRVIGPSCASALVLPSS